MEDYNIEAIFQLLMAEDEERWQLVSAMELPMEIKLELWKYTVKYIMTGKYDYLGFYSLKAEKCIRWCMRTPFNSIYQTFGKIDEEVRIPLFIEMSCHDNEIKSRSFYFKRYKHDIPIACFCDAMDEYYNQVFAPRLSMPLLNTIGLNNDQIVRSIIQKHS